MVKDMSEYNGLVWVQVGVVQVDGYDMSYLDVDKLLHGMQKRSNSIAEVESIWQVTRDSSSYLFCFNAL